MCDSVWNVSVVIWRLEQFHTNQNCDKPKGNRPVTILIGRWCISLDRKFTREYILMGAQFHNTGIIPCNSSINALSEKPRWGIWVTTPLDKFGCEPMVLALKWLFCRQMSKNENYHRWIDKKNIGRLTVHAFVSRPNPKQWTIVHTSDLMMIIKQSIYIISIIAREMGKLKTHSPTYYIMDNGVKMTNLTHTLDKIYLAGIL